MKVGWKTCIRIGLTALLVYFCIANDSFLLNALGAAIPLFVGCALAYIINIPMCFYERHFFPKSKKKFIQKLRRPLCMIFAIITIILIIVLIFSLIIPELTKCIQELIKQIPDAVNDFLDFLERQGLATEEMSKELSKVNWSEMAGNIASFVGSSFGNVTTFLATIVSSVFSIVVSTLLSIIFACYILISKQKLRVQVNKLIDCYLSKKVAKKLRYYSLVFNESFHKYIVGQCTEAVILGVLCTIGMVILQLPYYTMIGALVAFTALIPIVGAYVGAIVGAFMISSADPFKALIFLLFLIILQQFEGNIIYPKVVGTSVGLPAIWVLLAVTIGGGVAGVPGMLIGVPLAASIYRILRHDVRKKVALLETPKTEESQN